MSRRSSLRHLPMDVERLAVALILEGRATIDDITQTIGATGHRISRSAVGRFKKAVDRSLPASEADRALHRAKLLAQLQTRKPRVRVKALSAAPA